MNVNGIFIIIANSIGAGLFGIPITCHLAGFLPSVIIMLVIALYMNITAKLIIKINFIYKSNDIIDVSNKNLGNTVKIINICVFILLFSAILAAYLSKSADLSKMMLDQLISFNINKYFYYFFLILIVAIIINIKRTQFDSINKILVAIFIIIFFLLIYELMYHVKVENLLQHNINNIKYIYPILITSFGFHNILPYIKNTNTDYNTIKNLINFGVFFTFLIYFVWIFIILSVIDNNQSMLQAYNYDKIVTELIITYTASKNVYITINLLAFLAILTSILGISISMKIFLENLLNLKKNIYNKLLIIAAIFSLPIFMTFMYKNIFFKALNFSGGILALILFGLLPCLIILKDKGKNFKNKTLFKAMILTIITISAMIFFIISDI